MDAIMLKKSIIKSLEEQGFRIDNGQVLPPDDINKDKIRDLHTLSVRYRVERGKKGLYKYEPRLLSRIATGEEITPEAIQPTLIEVDPKSEDELLFRYISLHWSIPVSKGYGRRLRFLVIDQANNKLIGIIGLGDPVIALAPRDKWIGWNQDTRHQRLRYVIDAFVLGAVPPYSYLLCGKLVALLAASDDVRGRFFSKYIERHSLIQNRGHDTEPVLITTMSALGKSSIYNRLKYPEGISYVSVGYTSGYGEFHFSNGLYQDIAQYALNNCSPTSKNKKWGTGFRNRREVIRKVLLHIGISDEWMHHGLQREIFVVPLASNSREFLRGEQDKLAFFRHSATDIFSWFRQRWLLPRAKKDSRYQAFTPESYRLWSDGGKEICGQSSGSATPQALGVTVDEEQYAARGAI
jgi:hypothetical protein